MIEFAIQVREFVNENPFVNIPIIFITSYIVGWIICTILLRLNKPVVWGDFGKLLQTTLQDTKNWKWWTVVCKSSISYESNGQLIICCDNNKFSINHNIIDSYLSKEEKKELKKLVKNIFKILEEQDKQAQLELERQNKQQLLDDLATLNKKPEEKEKSSIVMRTASGHYISFTDVPHYPISKETEVAVQVGLSDDEKLILEELSDPLLWEYNFEYSEHKVLKTKKILHGLTSGNFYIVDSGYKQAVISPKNKLIFTKMVDKILLILSHNKS